MTTWTPPQTWTLFELFTHTAGNAQLMQNQLFLKTRAYGYDTVAAASRTAGFIPAAISGLSVSLTTTGSNVLMIFTTSILTTVGASTISLRFLIDGVAYGGVAFETLGANLYTPVCMRQFTTTPPSAGNHTYQVSWTSSSQTVSVAADITSLSIMESF